jgi:hypothetical protein
MMFVRRELALGGHEMLVPGADVEDVTWHGEAARAFGVNWAVFHLSVMPAKRVPLISSETS